MGYTEAVSYDRANNCNPVIKVEAAPTLTVVHYDQKPRTPYNDSVHARKEKTTNKPKPKQPIQNNEHCKTLIKKKLELC